VAFKLTAVKLSSMPDVQVQMVAHALDIPPFMLSRWRKEVREGVLKGRPKRPAVESRQAREIKRLQVLERERTGVIFHSDRGVEYAAYAFRNRLAALGFMQSMNRPPEVTDNAHMESFFHSMKSDAIHGVSFEHEAELVRRLRSHIPYYNSVRLHSGIGYFSPIDYEERTK
jgi:transposase InsO family protein